MCTFNEIRPLAIILVADDNALSRELIRELLAGSGQVAKSSDSSRSFGIAPHSLTYTLSALQFWNKPYEIGSSLASFEMMFVDLEGLDLRFQSS